MNNFERNFIPEPNSGCFLWIGTIIPKGYGHFKCDGKTFRAHRYSWELENGKIPDGLHVLHRCDIRSCVNVDHLFLGTNADNMADRGRKGRTQNIGIKNTIKTHCPKGHLYDEKNTYFRPNGSRKCRTCNAISMKERFYNAISH